MHSDCSNSPVEDEWPPLVAPVFWLVLCFVPLVFGCVMIFKSAW